MRFRERSQILRSRLNQCALRIKRFQETEFARVEALARRLVGDRKSVV